MKIIVSSFCIVLKKRCLIKTNAADLDLVAHQSGRAE